MSMPCQTSLTGLPVVQVPPHELAAGAGVGETGTERLHHQRLLTPGIIREHQTHSWDLLNVNIQDMQTLKLKSSKL